MPGARLLLPLLLLGPVPACSSDPDPRPPGAEELCGGGPIGDSGAFVSGLGEDPPRLECEPEGPPLELDLAELRGRIVGAWRVCEGELIDPLVRGVVFDREGRWTALRDLEEEIVADYTTAGPALDLAEGTGSSEIALWLVGGGRLTGEVEVLDGPRLALAFPGPAGQREARLVPARAGPAPFDGCTPEVPARLPRCAEDVSASVIGRWKLCRGEPPFGDDPPGIVALEVRSDGSWAWLRATSEGGLEPHPELQGPRFQVKDRRETEGPAGWKVELVGAAGGVEIVGVAYHPGDPPRLVITGDGEGSATGVYAAVPP